MVTGGWLRGQLLFTLGNARQRSRLVEEKQGKANRKRSCGSRRDYAVPDSLAAQSVRGMNWREACAQDVFPWLLVVAAGGSLRASGDQAQYGRWTKQRWWWLVVDSGFGARIAVRDAATCRRACVVVILAWFHWKVWDHPPAHPWTTRCAASQWMCWLQVLGTKPLRRAPWRTGALKAT
jgi:hypothetical protein